MAAVDAEGDEVPTGPPLHALQEDQFVEVIVKRMVEEVELPTFQEL